MLQDEGGVCCSSEYVVFMSLKALEASFYVKSTRQIPFKPSKENQANCTGLDRENGTRDLRGSHEIHVSRHTFQWMWVLCKAGIPVFPRIYLLE